MKNFFYRATRLTRILGLLAFATVFILGENFFIAPQPALAAGPRVTICHRTKSTSNPYRLITVSNNAVNNAGHGGHSGSVWTPSNSNGQTWGDIIPDYSGDGTQFWANGGVANKDVNWTGDSTSGGKSFMLPGGANISKCVRMTARRFYEISKLANQTDDQIAADLNAQEANEDAVLKAAAGGSFTEANVASAVGGVSVTTNSPSTIGSDSATLVGTISTGGTSTTPKFQYGTSATLETFTTISGGAASSSSSISASASLTGLLTGTTYYYRVIGEIGSEDSLGTYFGNIVSFTTGRQVRTLTVNAAATSISLGQTTTLSATPSIDASGTTTYEVVEGVLYCSISGSTLTASATNTGTCTVRATDGGNSTYSSSVSPTIDINVTASTPRTLEIDALSFASSYAFDAGTKPTITSTASAGNSNGTKSYSSSTTSVCTVNSSSGLVAFVSSGTCTISASITAADGFASANATAISFTITALSRTLTLSGDSGPYAVNASEPTMSATPSAGAGTVTYSSSTTTVCTVDSSTGAVDFVDAGSCSITASVVAHLGYAAANSNTRTFTITATSRTLTINAGSYTSAYSGDATPPTITSTASAGSGTKQYSSSTTSVCTINSSSGVVTFVAAGTCTIGATIGSSGIYASATASTISFTISSNPTTSTTSVAPATTVASATTSTVRATPNVSTTVASQIVNNSRRISICHATGSASNPYVLITVDRNGLNGHGDHAGDIIPAPATGCPRQLVSTGSTSSTTSSTVAVGRVRICHATASGLFVAITVDRNSLSGHGDHVDDIIPAPAEGCPYSLRQMALQLVSSTTTVEGAPNTPRTTVPLPAGKVSICHATSAGFYVEITVDRSGLNGHGDHEGDMIPAPATGCPTAVQRQAAPTTTLAPGKISICHATGAGIYVQITVDRNGLNGHGDHEGDMFPAPADGCPSRVESFSSPTTSSIPAAKIAICHATSGGSYELVLVNKGQLGVHAAHSQDIIPAPVGGCPNPSTTRDSSTTLPCINARELENFDESQKSVTDGVEVDAEPSSDDPDSGTISISAPEDGSGLSLVSAESIDPNIKITVKSSGVDYNKAVTWVNEGYGKFCWKIEPFGDRDYIYTLPNPPTPPDARYAGLAYSTVIVKAGSLTTTDPSYQVNSLFYSPEAGSGVFADVNKNGVSDPGGQGGGTLGDKAISHVIVCVGDVEVAAVGSSTTVAPTSTARVFLTTSTTINWAADFCPEPTTTTSSPSDSTTSSTTTTTTSTTIPGSSSTSTTAPGSSTSTTAPGGSTTTVPGTPTTGSTTTSTPAGTFTTTTVGGGSDDPNPPIEFLVETLRVPESGYTDLVVTLTDGEKSEVVFLQLDVRNFKVIAQSLPATGQSKYLPEQKYGLALLTIGFGLMLVQLRRRSTQR